MKQISGFSLIEMMVVIAIVSILSAMATPNILKWVSHQQFNSAVRDIQATIESMRLFAVKENAESTITFTDGASTYETNKWKRGLGTGPDAHEIKTYNLSSGIVVFSSFAGGKLIFTSRGTATSGTVTINGPNGLSLQIFVNVTGGSRIS